MIKSNRTDNGKLHIELELINEVADDCFSTNRLTPASEAKRAFMEFVGYEYDKYVLHLAKPPKININ